MAADSGGGGGVDPGTPLDLNFLGGSYAAGAGAAGVASAPASSPSPYSPSGPGASSSPGSSGMSSSGGYIPQDVWALLRQMHYPGSDINAPPPDWAVQFTEDELDASNQGDLFGAPLAGFSFPTNLSVSEFSQIESWAHTFAANSNWKYMPTGQMIMAAYNMGITDKSQAFSMWFGRLDPAHQSAVPWLRFGYSELQFNQTQGQYTDVLNTLTGSDNLSQLPSDLVGQAMTNNWSSSKFEAAARAALSATNPWLAQKYGYNYQSWQAYKRTNQQAIIDRYGASGQTDQNFLNNVDNPLQTTQQSRGGSVNFATGPKGPWGNASNLFDTASNAVR